MTEVVHIDDLYVEVRRSKRRRTVDLIVDRSGDVVINIPEALPSQQLEAIVREKQGWIYTKLDQKEGVLTAGGRREYVSGEGFYYLGKKYRLQLVNPEDVAADTPPLKLLNGCFLMPRSAAAEGCHHFIKWYTQQGQEWIRHAAEMLKDRVLARPRSITVRDLKFRWGSCNLAGDVYFHWRVTLLPPKAVRYLILHELVHLHEHNHSPAFYKRLGRAVPDHSEIEAWLEANGSHYSL